MENENNSSGKPHDCCMSRHSEQKGGFQKYALAIMVGIVLVMSIVQAFQINGMKKAKIADSITANAASGALDMSQWTEDEKMMYEHHGTLPSRAAGQVPQQGSNMVGGC